MYTILYSYIRKMIVSNVVVVFLILISLSSIIRLIDELRKMGTQSYSLYEIIIYLFLSLPKDFELFFPIVTLLGGLLGLGVLEIHNEFITMQVFGISKLQIALSVIKASIPILLCGIISSEWILPYSEQALCTYRHYIQRDIELASKKSENLLWFVDNNCFFCIDRVLTCSELAGITLYYFDKHKKLKQVLFAEHAFFANDIWHLSNIDQLDFSVEMCVTNHKISHIEWSAVLIPHTLSMLLKHPSVLSISKLYYCIRYLNQVGQNSKYYQLIFWNKVLSPFSGFVMVLVAIACTFGPFYKRKVNVRLFFGAIIGFVFYILNQIFGILSMTYYAVSPVIGSVFSAVIFLIISIIVMWKYY